MKRKLLVIFSMIFALIGALACTVACGEDPVTEEPPVAGEEAGEYYCDVDGVEYTLTLTQECKYTLVLDGDPITGDYSPAGDTLTLAYGDLTMTATYRSGTVTLQYSEDITYVFLRKIDYTVTFDTGDGTAVPAQTVVNGRKAQRPDDPTLTDMVFVGWYTDKAYKTLYHFNEPVISSLTLYARFVAAVEGEDYTVEFDLGYEDAEPIPAQTTVGGVLYELPEPERDGETFVGWWVSHYGLREKLTYQYKEQKLNGPVTLYAVWESDAPVVSAEESGITWSAPGVGNSYAVEIVGPGGSTVYSSTSGLTSYVFDFANAQEGDYVVSVTLNGQTGKAFYLNKALAKPSALRVEESTFLFDPVDHAESYTLKVVCGSEDHDHSAVELGSETSWSFEGCEMPEGGFVFTVTASAEGWLSAESDPFTFTRTLDAVSDLTVDPETDVAQWGEISHATGYVVTVKRAGGDAVYEGTVQETSFSLAKYAPATYSVSVKPVARGWFSPDAAEQEYAKKRLPAPENLHIEGTTLVWDAVSGAQSYEIKIGDEDPVPAGNGTRFEFTDAYVKDGQTEYSISVRALGNSADEHSFFCEEIVGHYGEMTTNTLSYNKGVLSWDPVFGVSNYQVTVAAENVETQQFTVEKANRTQITFKGKGETTLTVCAILNDEGETSQSFSITVTVHELSFDAQQGVPVDSYFLATGDDIPALPQAVYGEGGYDFYAWYTTPGGTQDGGVKFEDTVFDYESDKRVYAAWNPQTYTVTFDKGLYGAAEMDPQQVQYRASSYFFPVPESITPEMAFAGWYSDSDGAGTQYTDYTGHSTRAWTDFSGLTLHARWVAVFEFEEVSDGYSVSKGPGITYVGEITIPQSHLGSPVTTINDFSNLNTLYVVNFPDTVKNITLGSIGIAFNGCNNLQKINVDKVQGTHDPIYWSEDGILLGKIQATGDVEIIFYPRQHDLSGSDNIYTVPDGVTRIGASTFQANDTSVGATKANTIRGIILPASVREVAANAFEITTVREITFLDPTDGSVAQPLTIAENAFMKMWALRTLNLPARLADFNVAMIDSSDGNGAMRLTKINIAEGGTKFASVEGLPCRILPNNGRELLFYPIPTRQPDTTDDLEITDVVIPAGVTAIAANVIPTSCVAKIETITIANTVTDIAAGAFEGYVNTYDRNVRFEKLEEVNFLGGADDKDLTIGARAFYGAALLAPEIVLPENLISLGEYAFGGIEITTVTVNCGSNGRELQFAANAFATSDSKHTTYVETVNLGPNVSAIEIAGVFGGNVKAVNVDPANQNFRSADGVLFNKDMTQILFYSDQKTDAFVVPAEVTSIAPNLFKSRTNLPEISFPASLTSIGSGAFEGCTNLTSVTFRNGPEDGAPADLVIGSRAFYGCTGLTQISLPDTLKEIGSEAFASSGLTTVTLNDGLQTIGEKAFASLTKITTITIPASVTSLGLTEDSFTTYSKGDAVTNTIYSMNIFNGCTALTEIKVDAGNANYVSVDGVLYCKADEGKELLYCPRGKSGTVTVPSDTTKIHTNAFYYAGVTNIVFEGQNKPLELEKRAFYQARSLTQLTLPEGTAEIPAGAISYCTELKVVTIPTTVSHIGVQAFEGDSGLFTVTFTPGGETPLVLEGGWGWSLPDSDHTTSDTISNQQSVFYGCNQLHSITLPERTTEIGDYVFYNCTPITSISIPKNVTRIGIGAFYSCGLAELTLPLDSKLVTIDRLAFGKTLGLQTKTQLVLPATMRTIGKEAFCESGVSKIVFSEGLETIGDLAFTGSALEGDITLPASLRTIGIAAFSSYQFKPAVGGGTVQQIYAPPVTSVTFAPNSLLESIGTNAFGGERGDSASDTNHRNTHLKSVDFGTPAGAFEIGDYAFSHCTALTTVILPVGVKSIGKNAFASDPELTTVTFKEGTHVLESIADNAFKGTALTSFSFPNTASDVKLGKSLFAGCENMTIHLGSHITNLDGVLADCTVVGFTIDPANTHFHLDENGAPILYDSDDSIISIFGELTGSLMIKGNKVAPSAFAGQPLTSVTIAATVAEIGANAFDGCKQLATVTFASGSGLSTIGAYAFHGCTALTKVDLGSTTLLSDIGNYAFDGCKLLSDFNFEITRTLKRIGTYAFRETALTKADLSHNTALTSIETYAFAKTASLTTVTFPALLSYIGPYAFTESGLTAADLSDTLLTQFGSSATRTADASSTSAAFKNCKDLLTVTLPDGLERIGANTFENCEKLKTINLENVALIGNSAFKGCAALDNATLAGGGDGVELGTEAFHGCAALQKVDLTNVYKIGNKAFQESGLTSVKIPNTIDIQITGSSAGNFGSSVFADCAELKTVEIEEGVKYLRDRTFQNCVSLQTVEFPASISFVSKGSTISYMYSYYTFAGCTGLQSVKFKDNTSEESLSITQYMFQNCTGLKTVEIGTGLVLVEKEAFSGCTSLQSVTYAGGTEKVTFKDSVFANCGFTDVTVPNAAAMGKTMYQNNTKLAHVSFADDFALTTLPASMFVGCTALESFKFPDSCTGTGDTVFQNAGLTSVDFNKVTDIGKNAFEGTKFVNLTIPSTVKTVNSSGKQFLNCLSLKSVTIEGGGLTDLGTELFSGCTALDTVTLGEGITDMGDNTFKGCTALKSVPLPASVTTLGKGTFIGDATSYTIPAQITEIGAYAFDGYAQLTSVTFNAGLKKIGNYAFRGTGLTKVEVPDVELGSYIFQNCTSLKDVTFAQGFKGTTLGNYMFSGCSALQQITLPDTLTTTGTYTFQKTGLTSIDLTNTKITRLGATGTFSATTTGYVFDSCASLASVTLPATLKEIGSFSFQNCTSLQTITLPEGVKTIATSAFKGSGLTKVEVPALTGMGERVFENCKSLSNVTFSENFTMTTLGNYMFSGCTALEQITLPKSLTATGSYTFQKSGLTSIDLSQTKITRIGTTGSFSASTTGYVFDGCESLTSVILPTTLKEIGTYSFQNCKKLTKLELPAGVTGIANGVFKGSGLKTLILPESLATLGDSVFADCKDLTALYLPSAITVKQLKGSMFSGWTADQKVYTDLSAEDFQMKWGLLTGTSASFVYNTSLDSFKSLIGG